MQLKYKIEKINDSDVLFIFLSKDWNNEFGQINESNSRRKKIKFRGNKIKLILGGVAIATLTVSPLLIHNAMTNNNDNTSNSYQSSNISNSSSNESSISVEEVVDYAAKLLSDFNALDINTTITNDFELPINGENGSEIEWISENTSIAIENNLAHVTRPSHTQGDSSGQLIATLSIGGLSQEKTFDIVVLKQEINSQEKVDIDYENITLDIIDNVTEDFTLTGESQFDCIITWRSDDTAITINGSQATVTRPAFNEENIDVNLTVRIENGNVIREKTFTVTVLKNILSAEEIVELDYNYLNLDPFSVTENFTLENVGFYGSTITWQSDDESIIALNGYEAIVNRPEYFDGDINVRLIATIQNGAITRTKDFYVSVSRKEMSPEEASEQIFQEIDMYMSGYNQVSDAFPIPTYIYGFTIQWQAYSNYLYVNYNGIISVYRPSFAEGPQYASLDAMVSVEGRTFYRTYNLMIQSEPW